LYDNTKLAVARILGDGQRQKTRAFSELQSYYLFAEKFGRPAKGNDKDHVSYCTPLVRCEDTLVCSTSSYTPSAFFG